jgi:integrase
MAHIRKRGPSRHQVRFRGPDGLERSKTFRRQIDASRFKATIEADMARGRWVSPERARRTLEHYAEIWLSTLYCKPKTRESYESLLSKWILPTLGARPVEAISWSTVEAFKSEMLAAGRSPKTVTNALNVLRPILTAAVRDGALHSNPAREVRSPRSARIREARFETADTLSALARTMDESDGLLVVFAAVTGLRAGECGGLMVGDLDLVRGRLTVRRSVSEAHGRAEYVTPKNGKPRAVSTPEVLCAKLADHLDHRGVASDPKAPVFCSPEGEILRHSNFYRRSFKPAVEAFGLHGFRFHDLRHSCAAMLIRQGAHPRVIMERLGHSSIQVTMDTYGHLFPGLDDSITAGLQEQFQDAFSVDPRPVRGLTALPHPA